MSKQRQPRTRARNVLVVVSGQPDPAFLRAQLQAWAKPDMRVRVVASPSLSPLAWLTNDEDAARDEAQVLANRAAEAIAPKAELAPTVGDADTGQAIEDALRSFPADEVLVVLAGEDGEAQQLMREVDRLDLPVKTLEIRSR
ncbi:MAG: hypothetical protein ACXVRK_15530 [Gaiellaceae bacterium]